jgi:tetratricopeptide (TPR) repeat protein
VDSALKADLKESAATWMVQSALREAVFGNSAQAQRDAEEALKLSPESKDVRAMAALVFARTGNKAQARSISDDLSALYVSNTVMQKAWLPLVHSQMAMHEQKYEEAIRLLEVVLPYEKGQLVGNLSYSCMIPAYLRGEAQLGAKAPHQAALEFEKIEANPGLIGNCWAAPLSGVAKARALAASGSTAEAKTSYRQFLTLWKDADPSIPLLQKAKVEAAKLR